MFPYNNWPKNLRLKEKEYLYTKKKTLKIKQHIHMCATEIFVIQVLTWKKRFK